MMNEEPSPQTSKSSQSTFKKTLRNYKKALFWTFFASFTIIMDGYDGALIGGILEHHVFRETYGIEKNGEYIINTLWSIIIIIGFPFGRILGIYVVGFIPFYIGPKWTMIIFLLLIFSVLFIPFFATSIIMLTSGLTLCGVMCGVFNILAPTYVNDCPSMIRQVMPIYIYLCTVIGQAVAQTVMFVLKDNNTKWSYRIPFAIQWLCPLILLITLPFSPESPYWLISKEKEKEADKSIRALVSEQTEEDIRKMISLLKIQNEREKAVEENVGYLDCFKGSDLQRIEITTIAWSIHALTGNAVVNLAPYYFSKIGLSSFYSYTMALLFSMLAIIGIVISWFLKLGIRKNYLIGITCLGFIQLSIACVDFTPIKSYLQAAMILTWSLVYNTTIGPYCYKIMFELPSKRLREKTIALTSMVYSIVSIIFQTATIVFLNEDGFFISGKIGFFYFTTCAVSLVYCFFRIPELKNRSYAELTVLLEKGINPRHSQSYVVTEEDRMLYL